MKSVKDLKKKLNYVVNESIEEAYSYMLFNPGKNDKKAQAIIDEAANKKDELIAMLNNKNELKDRKAVKAHFAKIKSEVLSLKEKLDSSVKQL